MQREEGLAITRKCRGDTEEVVVNHTYTCVRSPGSWVSTIVSSNVVFLSSRSGHMFVHKVLSMYDLDKDGLLSKTEAKKGAANFDINIKDLKVRHHYCFLTFTMIKNKTRRLCEN